MDENMSETFLLLRLEIPCTNFLNFNICRAQPTGKAKLVNSWVNWQTLTHWVPQGRRDQQS